MRTNIALKRVLGNHLDIDSGVQKIKGMFFINKDNEKSINLLFTKFWRFSAFSNRKLPLRGPSPENMAENIYFFSFIFGI